MIYINRFSKILHLVLLRESDTSTIAKKILSIVISQHGLPECIMSDCNPCFCGHFWEELMSLLNITLTFSMALYPQADGMAEVMNHTIE